MEGKKAVVWRVIKRYRNRRLYDSSRNRYITLRDIRDLVLTHVDFSVVDHSTQQDITHRVLLLILATLECTEHAVIECETLKRAIRKQAQRDR